MARHMYIVSWGGESRIQIATSMDALWKRIRKLYYPGCVVTIEDDTTCRIYKR